MKSYNSNMTTKAILKSEVNFHKKLGGSVSFDIYSMTAECFHDVQQLLNAIKRIFKVNVSPNITNRPCFEGKAFDGVDVEFVICTSRYKKITPDVMESIISDIPDSHHMLDTLEVTSV